MPGFLLCYLGVVSDHLVVVMTVWRGMWWSRRRAYSASAVYYQMADKMVLEAAANQSGGRLGGLQL